MESHPERHLFAPSITGSYNEAMYALLTLGIRPDTIPMKANGDMDMSLLEEWIEERRQAEQVYKKRKMEACGDKRT
jgi:hypothetical protein